MQQKREVVRSHSEDEEMESQEEEESFGKFSPQYNKPLLPGGLFLGRKAQNLPRKKCSLKSGRILKRGLILVLNSIKGPISLGILLRRNLAFCVYVNFTTCTFSGLTFWTDLPRLLAVTWQQ
jgi:hypothetical protein